MRTDVPPSSLIAAVRAAIRAADPSIAVYSVATMDELVGAQTSQSRFTMWLMGVFAACALVLAVVGIYGVMSYLVTQRTREIGIRLALGARGPDILRLVVGNGARLIGAGIAIGMAASFALQRLVVVAAVWRDRGRRGRRVRGGGSRRGRDAGVLPARAARDARQPA